VSPRRFSSLHACLLLLLLARSSPLLAESPPSAHAVLDASVDAVWDATIESLRDTGYKIREERRANGTVSGRRTRIGCLLSEPDRQ
jgi:hypothetical protein